MCKGLGGLEVAACARGLDALGRRRNEGRVVAKARVVVARASAEISGLQACKPTGWRAHSETRSMTKRGKLNIPGTPLCRALRMAALADEATATAKSATREKRMAVGRRGRESWERGEKGTRIYTVQGTQRSEAKSRSRRDYCWVYASLALLRCSILFILVAIMIDMSLWCSLPNTHPRLCSFNAADGEAIVVT